MYVRNLMHQVLNLLQLHCSRVVLYYFSDSFGVSLQAADQVFIWRCHPAGLQLCYLGLQTLGLIGQLAHHGVPDSKALVAGFTGGELTHVASGTLVTASAGHALRTSTLTCRTMALIAGDSPRVAVTSWRHTGRKVRGKLIPGIQINPGRGIRHEEELM